ncbi:hypothetical protein BJ912DRAFT_1054437 [Pholiota molesta]|nr:hypothetical protein BJ912DRAFT_1054437 [Pholiota molesta]
MSAVLVAVVSFLSALLPNTAVVAPVAVDANSPQHIASLVAWMIMVHPTAQAHPAAVLQCRESAVGLVTPRTVLDLTIPQVHTQTQTAPILQHPEKAPFLMRTTAHHLHRLL